MLDSMTCEPYGYIKHEIDDLYNIRVNEVEDSTQTTDMNIE